MESKSTDSEVPEKVHYSKDYSSFLHPRIPGKFMPDAIKRKSLPWLKARYLKVFNATMGNHSMALFYCAWKPARFREVLAADQEFETAIADAKAEIADRAAFMLYKGLGLIAGEEGSHEPTPQTGAVLAKIVESMAEKAPVKEVKKKSFKLTVSGLKRPGDEVALPPNPI